MDTNVVLSITAIEYFQAISQTEYRDIYLTPIIESRADQLEFSVMRFQDSDMNTIQLHTQCYTAQPTLHHSRYLCSVYPFKNKSPRLDCPWSLLAVANISLWTYQNPALLA
ncbi:hypothetical protein BOTCAL_0254g00150 [Botryotinia calthae]|uniref:Uncharacterized protein n=1 Tax=Botryotinia calthae TaxID=38488 RepID=A0A4Y8CYR9_9HELO|nr:hypothetical protein BOTCAL_0254g00150 [Botryotinia calthae]